MRERCYRWEQNPPGLILDQICYARGGKQARVTDANFILGRLRCGVFLGDRMTLDLQTAESAMSSLAMQLDLSIEAAAERIVRVANEHMARALRVISV